ncbi:hypothetical protein RB195_008956 [Necator americanus]|uniref:Uncharacterized protein n=1 Tax=Necator americanus TaxID=51031 RepID=A0ABR1CR37_NECAM
MNAENDMEEEPNRRMRAAFEPVGEDQLTDREFPVHLFDLTVLPSLCYAAETWADTAATSSKLFTTHRSIDRCLQGFNRRT